MKTLEEFMQTLRTLFPMDATTEQEVRAKAVELDMENREMLYFNWMKHLGLLDSPGVCKTCGLPIHMGQCLVLPSEASRSSV